MSALKQMCPLPDPWSGVRARAGVCAGYKSGWLATTLSRSLSLSPARASKRTTEGDMASQRKRGRDLPASAEIRGKRFCDFVSRSSDTDGASSPALSQSSNGTDGETLKLHAKLIMLLYFVTPS